MCGWEGEVLDAEDRQEVIAQFSADDIDAEFLPYLARINVLPFVVSAQSCIGHMSYDKWLGPDEDRPIDHSTAWGYLRLMLTLEAAEWISKEAGWHWLWIPGSQLFVEGAGMPETTNNGSFFIAFASDSVHWPKPAIDVTEALEEFHRRYSYEERP